MDALSLATSIIQFIDFASNLVGKGIEIHKSTAGLTVDHNELGEITKSLVACSTEIEKSRQGQQGVSGAERELHQIATKCQDVAEELLGVLERLKSKGRRTRWDSFRRVLQSSWQEDKIQALEARLEKYRQQMVVNVLSSLRSQSNQAIEEQVSIRESIKRIEGRQQNSISVGDQFVRQLSDGEQWKHDVIQAIRDQEPGETLGAHLASIRGPDGKKPRAVVAQEKRIQARILQKLSFRNISDRERRICKAHEKTFEWIFHQVQNDSMPTSMGFRRFLQCSTEKIYWVTGKPGSGKSTLMKFIRQRTETTDILRDWAGDCDIIQAAFYFWNSGDHMQMTVEGLLQTILHECFQQLRWAIREVLPERWEVATLFEYDESPWTLEEITQALKKLFCEVCPDQKYFILIDGLDECCGDQTRLIELIAELAGQSENMKLCVASRPWTNFEDAFRGRPSLMLQDLTVQDIQDFIRSKFDASIGFAELRDRDPAASNDLLNDISKKAEGVFLWVQLVVQSLLDGLTNGDRVRDLQHRLAELPPDLEDLYARILEHLNARYLEHASQLFQIVRAHVGSPTLLCLAFADLEDGQTALKAPSRPLSSTEICDLCRNMKRKLASRCLGLLDTSSTNHAVNSKVGDEADLEVQYLHRSVRDYIESPDVWNWLTLANTESFDPNMALVRANLLQLKQDHRCRTERTFFLRTLTAIKHACISFDGHEHRFHGKKSELVRLLDELDKTGSYLTTLRDGSDQVFSDRRVALKGEHWSSLLIARVDRPSFLHLMTVCGATQYLKRRLTRSHFVADSDANTRMPLLLTALRGKIGVRDWNAYPKFPKPSDRRGVLKAILDKGGSCHEEWQGTSAFMQAEKWNDARILELFEKYGGEQSADAPETHQHASGESHGNSDKESEPSTEVVSTYSAHDSRTTTTRGASARAVRLHRRPAGLQSPMLCSQRSNGFGDGHHLYPGPRSYVPPPAYTHRLPIGLHRPPTWEGMQYFAPPRPFQESGNPFRQLQHPYEPQSGVPYTTGWGYYGPPSSSGYYWGQY